MNDLITQPTTPSFEAIKHIEDGVEYWYARELMPLLEYYKWENFHNIIEKAKASLKISYPQVEDHFAEVRKKIKVAEGTNKEALRELVDYKLTRHACYLIAQNGDSRKKTIALAQAYFATQTRKHELFESREKNLQRVIARRKLSETEKKFAGVLTQRGVKGAEIGEIKSAGDEALFGETTQNIKAKLGIEETKPLADFLPTISIKAKDLAMEMTTFNTMKNGLQVKETIKNEHVGNNAAVRKMLNENGIYPERLPAEEDVKLLAKKFNPTEVAGLSEQQLLSLENLEVDFRDLNEEELLNISEIIHSNPGKAKLVVYYGSLVEPKVLELAVDINAEVIRALKKYLILVNPVK